MWKIILKSFQLIINLMDLLFSYFIYHFKLFLFIFYFSLLYQLSFILLYLFGLLFLFQTIILKDVSLPKLKAYSYNLQSHEKFFANSSDSELLSLPIGEHLNDQDVLMVCNGIKAYFEK